jgi:hypothetical protein
MIVTTAAQTGTIILRFTAKPIMVIRVMSTPNNINTIFSRVSRRGDDYGSNSRFENGTNNNSSINVLGNILENILIFERL